MNQDPHGAFDGTNASQTNPFTGDLKGEFTSDFGTNTNAVSHIGEGMGGGDKKRTLIYVLGGVAIAAIAAFFYVMNNEDTFDDNDFTQKTGEQQEEQAAAPSTPAEDAVTDEPAAPTDDKVAKKPEEKTDTNTATKPAEKPGEKVDKAVQAEKSPESAPTTMAQTGSIAVNSPFEGASLPYDETQGPATFSWTGSADRIVFARNASMVPIVRSRNITGKQSYRFLHPHPGRWFWRLENGEGGTNPQSFSIAAPVRRNFPVSQPQAGAQISGNGGVVAWQGDSKIARYMVQIVPQGSSWATPAHQLGTSGTSVALQGVAKGNYDFRVGAFSEVAGRWEWQVIPGVVVQ